MSTWMVRILVAACLAPSLLMACGSDDAPDRSASDISVTIDPPEATIQVGGSQTFAATVSGTSHTDVEWSVQEGVTAGTVTEQGTYTAPDTPGTYHVVATSMAEPTESGRAVVTVVEEDAISISITAEHPYLFSGGRTTVVATVDGTEDQRVWWFTGGGSITTEGVYTAPEEPGDYSIVAVSQADPTRSASLTMPVIRRLPYTLEYAVFDGYGLDLKAPDRLSPGYAAADADLAWTEPDSSTGQLLPMNGAGLQAMGTLPVHPYECHGMNLSSNPITTDELHPGGWLCAHTRDGFPASIRITETPQEGGYLALEPYPPVFAHTLEAVTLSPNDECHLAGDCPAAPWPSGDLRWAIINATAGERELRPQKADFAVVGTEPFPPALCVNVELSKTRIDASGPDYGDIPVGTWLCARNEEGTFFSIRIAGYEDDDFADIDLEIYREP